MSAINERTKDSMQVKTKIPPYSAKHRIRSLNFLVSPDTASFFLFFFPNVYLKLSVQFLCLDYLVYVDILNDYFRDVLYLYKDQLQEVTSAQDLICLILKIRILYRKICTIFQIVNETFKMSLLFGFFDAFCISVVYSYYFFVKLLGVSNVTDGKNARFLIMGNDLIFSLHSKDLTYTMFIIISCLYRN